MIPESVLNQIQDRIDIVEIISAYVPLKGAGRNFKAPCPFHPEKTPSFMVSADKQIFHCFGCGVGGNVFSFLMKQEKKDFREVVEMLADRAGVEIPKDKVISPQAVERSTALVKANEFAAGFYHRFLLEKKEAEDARLYLAKRGISDATIKNFKLGFAPDAWDGLCRAAKERIPDAVLEKAGLVVSKKEGGFYDRFRRRILFPIVDVKGACVAFGGRVLDESLPKYLNSPETEIYIKGKHLYGFAQARKAIHDSDAVIVVEGYMDVIACHQAGVENVVASLGTALTVDQVRLVKRNTKNVFILYDADQAGELATLRGLELFLEEGLDVKIVRLPSGHDPDSFIKERGVGHFKEALSKAQTLFDYKLAILKEKFDPRAVEGRVKIANEMVLLFRKVPNEILRSVWVRELARELTLSEEALMTEVHKAAEKGKGFTVSAPPPPQNEVRSVEKLLIGLMLDHPDFVLRAREEVRADDFQHPAARNIVKRLLEGANTSPLVSQLVNFYKDDPDAVRLISLSCAEIEAILDKQKTFADCLLWVKRSRITTQREGLRTEILAAQRQGDKNRINQLLYDFNELNKGMRKINEKK